MKKKTIEDIIKEAQKIYGDKYDYSNAEYVNANTPISIICPIHGEFEKSVYKHINLKQECPQCKIEGKKLTNEEFIEKANKVHNNFYDYSKTIYLHGKQKVLIICPIHGEFLQKPNNHLNGQGCPQCAIDKRRITMDDFIERSNQVHNNKYTYINVEFKGVFDEVLITCKKHGDFSQTPASHLQGRGCPKCAREKKTDTLEDFIEKANKIHNNKYDYSKVEYLGSKHNVNIICPQHGMFQQSPNTHLQGKGCPKCKSDTIRNKLSSTLENFIKKANTVHNNFYSYLNSIYKNNRTPISIICPVHGEFEQEPRVHLSGAGCPQCNSSKLENEIKKLLIENNIEFIEQASRKHLQWLGLQTLDFYIPQYNIAIECQGEQHFLPIKHFGGEDKLKLIQERDKRKRDKCNENNIKLLYYSNLNIKYPYKVFENKEDLLMEVKI